MAMSDCDECWDTPCTCGHGYERPRMSLDRLRQVVAAASRTLADREATGDPEPVLHPVRRLTAEEWGASIEIPADLLAVDDRYKRYFPPSPDDVSNHPAQPAFRARKDSK